MTMPERPSLIRPGMFGVEAAADARRGVFDSHNEALVAYSVPIDAVFIGDSITEMWALDAFFQGTNGFIINRGISGDRTPFARRRFEADVLQLRPRLTVIAIGVNNTWDLDTPWDPSVYRSPEEIEEEIVSDVEAMVSSARRQQIAVALCSVLPTAIPADGNAAVRNQLIHRTNAGLRDVAGRHGAVYVDNHAELAADDGLTLRQGLADDGLHPHILGYEVMARVLLEALRPANTSLVRQRASTAKP